MIYPPRARQKKNEQCATRAAAFRLGRFVLTAVSLGGGGGAAYQAYKSHHIAAAVYYGILGLGAAVLVNAATLFRTSAPPPRLVVGGGSASGFPEVPQGSLSMNINPAHGPDIVGNISAAPFDGDTFSEVYFERVPYSAFTDENSGAISEAYRILTPGGRLVIVTGHGADAGEIVGLLQGAGFSGVSVSGGPGVSGANSVPYAITGVK